MMMRTESDSAGEVQVPQARYYGAQTARAIELFPKVGPRIPLAVIRAFGLQKKAAARANYALKIIDSRVSDAIQHAADELWTGQFDEDFPLPIWQTGSGTQTNMCANEILANRANELLGYPLGSRSPVHPNDHVNRSQSSNDSFPTVMHIAAVLAVEDLLPHIHELEKALEVSIAAHGDAVRIGRTHLNDAVPVTFGQNLQTWLSGIESGGTKITACLNELRLLSQGGTAAGSGLNAPARFDRLFCQELSILAGTQFEPHPVKGAGMAAHDALATLSATVKNFSLTIMRVANDIRHLGSGPRSGLGELNLPDDGLSSSIMPGKRNATQAEAIVQIVQHIVGNDKTVEMANASSLFELNVAKPVIIHAVLESITLLSSALPGFALFIAGITPNRDRMAYNVEMSLMLATALTPELGYDRVAELTREADEKSLSLREVVCRSNLLSPERFDALVQPHKMACGGVQNGGEG